MGREVNSGCLDSVMDGFETMDEFTGKLKEQERGLLIFLHFEG